MGAEQVTVLQLHKGSLDNVREMVIASGRSTRQLKKMADALVRAVRGRGTGGERTSSSFLHFSLLTLSDLLLSLSLTLSLRIYLPPPAASNLPYFPPSPLPPDQDQRAETCSRVQRRRGGER